MTIESTLTSLTTAVQNAATNISTKTRRQLIDTLRDLQYSLETPLETSQRLCYASNNLSTIRVCIDLKIYNLLAESKKPLRIEQISNHTTASPSLLTRLLRHQASLGHIAHPTPTTYAPNTVTHNLALPTVQAGILMNDALGPGFAALPAFLKDTKYANPQDMHDTPFLRGHESSGRTLFQWMSTHPEHMQFFKAHLSLIEAEPQDFWRYYPIESMSQGLQNEEDVVFVDVAGAMGAQCVALKEACPGLKGRVVLQELEYAVRRAVLPEGVEGMFYYFRRVLKDWPDEKVVEILKNTVSAMGPESHILIDDWVVPETGAPWFVTQADMCMLTMSGGQERSEEQWREVLSRSGLKIESVITYNEAFKMSIVDVVKA
ncbi:hypothetical protein M409DRAFT_68979 [Zasmidium cellare ATCC 36951]|uniref:Uncharacterized protein n=1 Tax=Zasmidium cellare ATCC 36951 TaxID=1080233 RepID=A0A6A6C6N5_ZASCE|nr:uncharacterized protein M409DRAFT_68979 [Zasmidium cellare ATCC 36951]KAF2162695.1 hypothetical protein M409DRAFT_68979 [Zasmidium cellare ATCC 36951]